MLHLKGVIHVKPKFFIQSLFLATAAFAQCDWNDDGLVDILDIVQTVNCILDQCYDGTQCDWTGDGVLDILDAVQTVNGILNDRGEALSGAVRIRMPLIIIPMPTRMTAHALMPSPIGIWTNCPEIHSLTSAGMPIMVRLQTQPGLRAMAAAPSILQTLPLSQYPIHQTSNPQAVSTLKQSFCWIRSCISRVCLFCPPIMMGAMGFGIIKGI